MLVEKVAMAGMVREPIAALSRLGRGVRNTGLALGAGAIAGGALGVGHQHDEDQRRFPLVYQPMASGYGS